MTRPIVMQPAPSFTPNRRVSRSFEELARDKKDIKVVEDIVPVVEKGEKQIVRSAEKVSPPRTRRPVSASKQQPKQQAQRREVEEEVEYDDDSVLRDEEEFGAYPSPYNSFRAAYLEETEVDNRPCAGLRNFFKVTWDVIRSVPLITLIWAGGAIFTSNLAARNIQTLGSKIFILNTLTSDLFRYMNYGLYSLDAINGGIALIAILFTGATLEILVKKNCKAQGCAGFCQRFSFRSLQGLFFPLSYIGFIAVLGVLLLTVVLAFTILMTNQSCDYTATAAGAASAASDLSNQVNTVTNWMGLKSVDVTPDALTNYCGSNHAVSTWFWRMTFIWIAAATLCQVNLSIAAWTIFLNTGFAIHKTDMARKHTETLEKIEIELDESRPMSMRSDATGASAFRPRSLRSESLGDRRSAPRRPSSAGRASNPVSGAGSESKECNEELDV